MWMLHVATTIRGIQCIDPWPVAPYTADTLKHRLFRLNKDQFTAASTPLAPAGSP
jgi:hypothetical protein